MRCGDYLVKKDASGEHAYKVTFKKEGVGMCLTYMDASVIETQSYDYVDGEWVYNSEDKTPNLLEIPMKLEDIVDKDGHNRFIEGDIVAEEVTGVTLTYGKWSLSGTHLLIVAIGIVENNTVWASAKFATLQNLPQWVKDKIVPIAGNYVVVKEYKLFGNDVSSQTSNTYLRKIDGDIRIDNGGITLTADRTFRMEFDLLIDNE